MAQKLGLIWVAKFSDDKTLRQFDDAEQTQEHLFRELQEYPAKLLIFQLENMRTQRIYQVDLEAGKIMQFSSPSLYTAPEAEVQGDKTRDYRLIYFRRITETVEWAGGGVKPAGKNVAYFVGFQYTDSEGKNVKRLVQISEQDEIYIA